MHRHGQPHVFALLFGQTDGACDQCRVFTDTHDMPFGFILTVSGGPGEHADDALVAVTQLGGARKHGLIELVAFGAQGLGGHAQCEAVTDAQQQLGQVKRLADVIIGTERQSLAAVFRAAECADNDDRRSAAIAVFERFQDIDATAMVPRVAASWTTIPGITLRGAWSQGFRAPNLVQVNDDGTTRSNTRDDFVFCQAQVRKGLLSSLDACPGAGVISFRSGAKSLRPEDSESINLGIVLEPSFIPGLTLTADFWRVKQTGLVGTFGDDNAIALDLLRRLGMEVAHTAHQGRTCLRKRVSNGTNRRLWNRLQRCAVPGLRRVGIPYPGAIGFVAINRTVRLGRQSP